MIVLVRTPCSSISKPLLIIIPLLSLLFAQNRLFHSESIRLHAKQSVGAWATGWIPSACLRCVPLRLAHSVVWQILRIVRYISVARSWSYHNRWKSRARSISLRAYSTSYSARILADYYFVVLDRPPSKSALHDAAHSHSNVFIPATSLLGGIFARNNSSCGSARNSKSAYDLHALPTISIAYFHQHLRCQRQRPVSSASSPTAEYVSVASAGPSSPNGCGLAYTGDPNLHPHGKGRTKGGGGELGFFTRKRSRNDLGSPVPAPEREREGRASYTYLDRMSMSSDLLPLSSVLLLEREIEAAVGSCVWESTRSPLPPQLHSPLSPTSLLLPA
ncbi:hypothetical protein C8R45DRAFT_552313 [Mycena sanguinolenta]|nr:hypothetical protein C8R45DRAFT_552313 [Mycena sanguinolenta]